MKVLDFGLAKLIQATQAQTPDDQQRELVGSIYTMAPEQFNEEPLGPSTDLYSLGCVLYFVLTGSYPFVGSTVEEVLAAHLSHTFLPLHEFRPDVPLSLSLWVTRLMEKSCEDRPVSADQALDQLNELDIELG